MIVLMGIKHSGKTSLGKLAAEYFNIPFMDLDNLLEKEYSKDRKFNFREIYNILGQTGFKDLETTALSNIQMNKKGILALGGGTIDNPDAIKFITKSDTRVFLDTEEQILHKRVEKNGFPPFLVKSPEKLFSELYKRRRFLYKNFATITIKFSDEKPKRMLEILLKNIEDKT